MLQFTPGKLLILEDDPGLSQLLGNRLRRLGHEVVLCQSAEQALLSAPKEEFDLFLLDYSLGGEMTGLGVYQILRERGINSPAILVTGFEDPKIIVESIRQGVRDFILKTAEVLDALPLSVERVLHQVRVERELVEARVLREKQEQLQTASESARLAYWNWDLKQNRCEWNGYYTEIFGFSTSMSLRAEDGFLPNVHPEDRNEFLRSLQLSRDSKSILEGEVRLSRADGSFAWVLVKGRFFYNSEGSATRMSGILVDITERKESQARLDQSYSQIQTLNDRLQLSVSETHHRVKNSLQSVISLINMQRRGKETLSSDDVQRILAHIQGVSSLHDILSDNAKTDGDASTVSVRLLFEKLLVFLTRSSIGRRIDAHLEECRVTARQGATLSVILNELVSNALKHSRGPIRISLESHQNTGKLCVENEGSQFPPDFNPEKTTRTGLVLLSMLCKTDLQHAPTFENASESVARVCVEFPIQNDSSV